MAGFSVPKKKFRHSVDRHRVRRLIVEAWRYQKDVVYKTVPAGLQVHMFFIFTDATLPAFETVDKSVKKSADKLCSIFAALTDAEIKRE